jgi:hypothetical protein
MIDCGLLGISCTQYVSRSGLFQVRDREVLNTLRGHTCNEAFFSGSQKLRDYPLRQWVTGAARLARPNTVRVPAAAPGGLPERVAAGRYTAVRHVDGGECTGCVRDEKLMDDAITLLAVALLAFAALPAYYRSRWRQ